MGAGRITVVLPCRNEERTVAECVLEARRAIAEMLREGEVVVVDNGSTDGSAAMAAAAGARVVKERRPGYGFALGRGLREARGDVIVTGDADGSYRFDDLRPLVEAVEGGADLVLGSRLRGGMEEGAFPWLHRRVAAPLLRFLVRLLFHATVGDVATGQRALRADVVKRLHLRAGGIEVSSEMIAKAALAGLVIAEVPVAYRRGRRTRRRRWRDLWRHVRFLLLFAPNATLLAPGALLLAAGAFLAGPALLGGSARGAAAFSGALLVLAGAQLVLVGAAAKIWYHVEGFHHRRYLEIALRHVGLEAGLLLGAGLLVSGALVARPLFLAWSYGEPPDAGRLAASLTLFVLGMQTVSGSLVLSILGIRRRS